MTKIEQKIPEGWCVKKLGELGVFSKGKGITKNELSLDGYPCIRYAEIYTLYNFTVNKCYSFISKETSLSSKAISSGCLLLAGSGETKEEIGKCVAYIGAEKVFVGGDTIVFAPNFKQIFPIYLSYFLNTVGRKQLNRLGQGDSIVHIHSQNLEKVKILLPPLAEQEKIAGILRCWDDGIEKLSALIEKKKIQKKALMQQLLTGKHRLKGFSSSWLEVKLGDILKERCEYTTINNQYPILTSSRKGIFKQEEYFDKQVASENNIGYKIIKQHDFTYRAMTDDDIFCFNELINESIGAVSPAYSVFYCSSISNVLLDAILNSKKFGANLIKVAQGGTRKSLKFSSLIKLKIFIPTDLAEQKAIAEILSKADEEIELLNKKLEAFKQEKKALMQQLLTGKIRVKVN